jgi:hypothetical protein
MYDHDDGIRKFNDDGSHKCEKSQCNDLVPFDDEPYCFTHSPDSGSFFVNYSYKNDTFKFGYNGQI